MCGIAGFAHAPLETEDALRLLWRMAGCLRHRGPDDAGAIWHEDDRVGLAHRRLAIVDPGPTGAQPMTSPSGRFTIVYNGEVCNTPRIAEELCRSGWRPRGRSDTEVMLAAFDTWGVETAIQRFAGMFAFAVHDHRRRTLHLVRDRIGVKPLHWAWVRRPEGRMLAFASEIRAILEVPGFSRQIDPDAVAGVLAYGCVTGSRCIWTGASKLAPAHHLTLDLSSGSISINCWWNAIDIAERQIATPFIGSDADAEEHGRNLLCEIVAENLKADVGVGCMLSGGIDSAVIAASIDQPIVAFTAGFPDPDFDERLRARTTAKFLSLNLHEVIVDPQSMIDAVSQMPEVHDEPFADSSQVPTWVLCREMRRHVKAVLSGDGGDEVFGGYRRHVHAASGWRIGRALPPALRAMISGAALGLSQEAWSAVARGIDPLLPRRLRTRSPGESLHKWARCLAADSEADAYRSLTTLSRAGAVAPESWWDRACSARLPDFLSRMQFADLTGYLVDDVLVKVDRSSMSHGLEVRVPLLDHRIIEFGWSLPEAMKVRDGRGKWLLRKILKRRMTLPTLENPKTGFGAPVGSWLRGPLRMWAGDLLGSRRLREDPMLDPRRIMDTWHSVQSGSDVAQHAMWSAVMYLAWSQRWEPRA